MNKKCFCLAHVKFGLSPEMMAPQVNYSKWVGLRVVALVSFVCFSCIGTDLSTKFAVHLMQQSRRRDSCRRLPLSGVCLNSTASLFLRVKVVRVLIRVAWVSYNGRILLYVWTFHIRSLFEGGLYSDLGVLPLQDQSVCFDAIACCTLLNVVWNSIWACRSFHSAHELCYIRLCFPWECCSELNLSILLSLNQSLWFNHTTSYIQFDGFHLHLSWSSSFLYDMTLYWPDSVLFTYMSLPPIHFILVVFVKFDLKSSSVRSRGICKDIWWGFWMLRLGTFKAILRSHCDYFSWQDNTIEVLSWVFCGVASGQGFVR